MYFDSAMIEIISSKTWDGTVGQNDAFPSSAQVFFGTLQVFQTAILKSISNTLISKIYDSKKWLKTASCRTPRPRPRHGDLHWSAAGLPHNNQTPSLRSCTGPTSFSLSPCLLLPTPPSWSVFEDMEEDPLPSKAPGREWSICGTTDALEGMF